MARWRLLALAPLVGTALLVPGLSSPSTAATGPAVVVDVTAGRHAISDGIYGMNFARADVAAALRLPIDRWGGNSTERYDWRSGLTNVASDYFFENVPDCFRASQDYCARDDHATYRSWAERFDQDQATKSATVVNLPATGWVSEGPATYGHPLVCAYRKPFVVSDAYDPYDEDCGSGRVNGTWTGGATPETTSMQVSDEELVGGWVDALKEKYGDAAHGGVRWYEPGNEPALWSSTHHDLYGDHHLTAEEQWARQSSVAAVVKAHDPTAQVMGPSEWGWTNYFCSDAEVAEGTCDVGSDDHTGWWLDQAKQWEATHGTRLVDALDLHVYPQSEDMGYDATRILWDPTYTDPSWVQAVQRLVPRMHDWVDQHYPGTKVVLGEYDFSLGHHDRRSAAVLQADALGVFARERVDIAMLWQTVLPTEPVYGAYTLFRNADGKGRSFGSTWVSTTSANQRQVGAYAAQRSDGSLTLVLVNKTKAALSVPVSLQHYRDSTVRPFTWNGGTAVVAGKPFLETGGRTSYSVPAEGMVLLDLSGKVEQPYLVTGLAAPTRAARGSTQTVTASLADAAGPRATHPWLQLVLPVGSRVQAVGAPTGWTCRTTYSSSTPTTRCTAPALAAGSRAVVRVRLTEPRSGTAARTTLTAGADVVARAVPPRTASTTLG